MAEAIGLDPGTYHGAYKLIGGAPALDFANLVSYRGTERHHDWLEPPGNVTTWSAAAGITVPVLSDVPVLQEFREVLARAFLAIADGGSPAPADVEHIGRQAVRAWADRRLTFPRGASAAGWTAARPSLLAAVALDAASLLTSADALRRIAACRECRWVFLDNTRNHARRWCDPADCGNRARQRRYYRRHASRPRA